jgi:hypothetical protein
MKQTFYEDSNFWPWVILCLLLILGGLYIPVQQNSPYWTCLKNVSIDYCQARGLEMQAYGAKPPLVLCSPEPLTKQRIHYLNASELAGCH